MGMTEDFDSKIIGTVNRERASVYAHPLDNFKRIAALFEVVRDCPDLEVRHALEMICVKVSRLVETPGHADSVLDIAGYARTIAMIHDERERRQQSRSEDETQQTTGPLSTADAYKELCRLAEQAEGRKPETVPERRTVNPADDPDGLCGWCGEPREECPENQRTGGSAKEAATERAGRFMEQRHKEMLQEAENDAKAREQLKAAVERVERQKEAESLLGAVDRVMQEEERPDKCAHCGRYGGAHNLSCPNSGYENGN